MRRAASLFTIVPVGTFLGLTRADARRAVAWLPWLGLVVGLVSGGISGLVVWWRPDAALLAAALGVGLWALITGAMHLDGLADTCDGLGSRRPAGEALAIMKRSDIGPMGVAAVVFAVLVDVAAASSLPPAALGVALALAPLVGRVPVAWATTPGLPPARESGFGALFAQVTPVRGAWVASVGALLVCAVAGGWLGWATVASGGAPVAASLVGAAALALVLAVAWGRALVRRFDGVTGDIMGAQIELGQAVFLVGAALLLA